MGDLLNDNRFVVPCNKYLLLRYNAHINAKWCNQSRFIKHLFKYFNKGQDHDTATFYQSATDEQQRCMDEIKKLYYNCRQLSSCETSWKLLNDNYQIDYTFNKPNSQKSKFMSWMEANKKYTKARHLTYSQFPSMFVWKQNEHEWRKRMGGFTVGI